MSLKPSFEYCMETWAKNPTLSCRKVEALLREEGYEVSYRTLQRWRDNGKPGQVALGHETKRAGVKREIAKALAKISDTEKLSADQMKVDGIVVAVQEEIIAGKVGGARDPAQEEVNIIDSRISALMVKSAAELDLDEQKARKIFNIVLLEAATRRANIMTMIPKETAALVDAMTTASKQTLTGGIDQPPKAGDPRVFDGEVVDVTPASPLASAIGKFFQAEGID